MDKTDKNSSSAVSDERLAGLRNHSDEINKLVTESLQGSLLKLICVKPYDKITVTELCRKAGVSRMAFYGNFTSKDNIFSKIVTDLQRDLMNKVGSPFRSPPTHSWYVKLFQFVQSKADVLGPIFRAGFRDKYLSLINAMVLRHANMQPDDAYLRLFWCGGIVNAVVYWVLSGMRESPRQMAEFFRRGVGGNV